MVPESCSMRVFEGTQATKAQGTKPRPPQSECRPAYLSTKLGVPSEYVALDKLASKSRGYYSLDLSFNMSAVQRGYKKKGAERVTEKPKVTDPPLLEWTRRGPPRCGRVVLVDVCNSVNSGSPEGVHTSILVDGTVDGAQAK
jgi:hypothetical protein